MIKVTGAAWTAAAASNAAAANTLRTAFIMSLLLYVLMNPSPRVLARG
jgi:hypothetical protein